MNCVNLSIAALMVFSFNCLAGELDGKQFCRTITTNGMLGQPSGEREHCLSFEKNVMNDNANTFFGNPPESTNYVLVAGKILVVKKGKLQSEYSVNMDLDQIMNGQGAKLELK